MNALKTLTTCFILSTVTACSCRSANHAIEASPLGAAISPEAMLAVIDQPGPIALETIDSADWASDRTGILDLSSEKARAAGLKDGLEPTHIFFHALKHPTQGTFLVDTGPESAFRDDPKHTLISGTGVEGSLHTDHLSVKTSTGDFVKAHAEGVKGVFMTHLHIDHVLGMRELPAETPVFTGPGEGHAERFLNLFTGPVVDKALEGKPALREWTFSSTGDERFAGLVDVFGDRSVFAWWMPGHTPGSVVYLARTATGPVMLTGDTCITAWGWDNEVTAGSFTDDHAANARGLATLKAFAAEHPGLSVRLGHQPH